MVKVVFNEICYFGVHTKVNYLKNHKYVHKSYCYYLIFSSKYKNSETHEFAMVMDFIHRKSLVSRRNLFPFA